MRIYKLSVELEVDQSVFAIECNIVKKQIKDLHFCVLLNLASILLLTLQYSVAPNDLLLGVASHAFNSDSMEISCSIFVHVHNIINPRHTVFHRLIALRLRSA